MRDSTPKRKILKRNKADVALDWSRHIRDGLHYMTKEGLEKLMEEITRLESQERPKIAQMIAEARDKGDLFTSFTARHS